MRSSVWLLVLLIPLASAGTQDAPEIKDVAGDVRWSPVPISPEQVPMPTGHDLTFDLLATWFHDETPDTISITTQVADLSRVEDFGPPGVGFARWGTRFELSNFEEDNRDEWWNYTWAVEIQLNNGPAGWVGSVSAPDRGGQRGLTTAQDFSVDLDSNTLTVVVERTTLGSPMAGDRMHDTLSLHDGRIGQIDFSDQKVGGSQPNLDYVFTMDSRTAEGSAVTGNETTSNGPNGTSDPKMPTGKEASAAGALAPVIMALALLARRRQ